MKIVSETPDKMVLKDGNIINTIFATISGGVLIYFGIWIFIALISVKGMNYAVTLIPIVLIIIGAAMSLFSYSSIAITLDKPQGQLIYSRKRFIGSRHGVYAIGNVLQVDLRRSGVLMGGNNSLRSQTIIVLKDGTELPLENLKNRGAGGFTGTVAMMAGEGKEISISNKVAAFMGVPFTEMGAQNNGVNIGGIQL